MDERAAGEPAEGEAMMHEARKGDFLTQACPSTVRTPRLNEKEFLADVLRPFHDAIVKVLAPHFHELDALVDYRIEAVGSHAIGGCVGSSRIVVLGQQYNTVFNALAGRDNRVIFVLIRFYSKHSATQTMRPCAPLSDHPPRGSVFLVFREWVVPLLAPLSG
jgi:hypothetical protein